MLQKNIFKVRVWFFATTGTYVIQLISNIKKL